MSPDIRLWNDNTVVSVSALTRAINAHLEELFPRVWVSGEISNFARAASGHWYFSLKDEAAQLRCVMFRMRAQKVAFMPREGDHIEVCGRVTMYEPRGECQLNAEQLRRTGAGRLYEAFMALKQRLENEGLFDVAKKRALPVYPRAIGVVTSLAAAALCDVLTTLARRAPHLPVIVYPAPVQGAGSAAQLAAMVECANRRAEVDVLIVCRGGGSLEDLWAFNEEALVRAIAASALPVISGVGHQTDFTLVDFAADVRAPTPTGAAEQVSAPRAQLLRALSDLHMRQRRVQQRLHERRAQQLDWLARRLISPVERLAQQRSDLRQQALRFSAALKRQQAGRCAQIREYAARCTALSPQQTLARGYAVLLDPYSKCALRTPAALSSGKRVRVHLAQGCTEVGITDPQPCASLF
ncbi:Exodeoxyribonuclease 7 large subunit (Exodeoxyribonuclease VII large subunit) (Exonuclease VII large subunit) [Candidatus Glomeribacter gigasporarum BEG34]|uniref:Exodeoxyribonuclease 7 large subunit n=1 Tax=Candidatus Glomeribacter gigasporarum BEG34 TaxID=1070319 RepID=G2J7J3_9BURK|nr:exodeoxyribonuclease VII large subunit [Candidatus Glomeribacter gigasporarum]CCD28738.1 Exodeoxyribonuclease 7 large subunit (Exodeoxyribonuclease VII large subunit) (Exonuclease VII large subunit) [Candidatus Glomeribacter gigasporarum BEG34]